MVTCNPRQPTTWIGDWHLNNSSTSISAGEEGGMSSSEMKNMSCQRLNEVLIATNGKHVCIYIYIWDGVSSLEWQPALRWCLKKIIWTTMCLSWISRRVSSVVKPYLKSFWQDSLSGMIQLALCVINPCPGSLKNTPMYVVMHVCN